MEILLEDFSMGKLIALAISAGLLFLFFYCLYDIVTSEFPGMEGMLWALIVFFAPGIGMLVYFIYGRQRKIKS